MSVSHTGLLMVGIPIDDLVQIIVEPTTVTMYDQYTGKPYLKHEQEISYSLGNLLFMPKYWKDDEYVLEVLGKKKSTKLAVFNQNDFGDFPNRIFGFLVQEVQNNQIREISIDLIDLFRKKLDELTNEFGIECESKLFLIHSAR